MKRLLLIGGGHSHVEVLRQFGLAPLADVEIVLVSPDRLTPYSGMLPGWVAGHYTVADCHIDLDVVARFAGARFVRSTVTRLDPGTRIATLADGQSITYDAASLDIGSTPPTSAIAGAADLGVPVKPVARFIEAIERLGREASAGGIRRIAVIGGGPAGVEILLAARHRVLAMQRQAALETVLLAASPHVLPGHGAGVRRLMTRELARQGVAVHCDFAAARVERDHVVAADGRTVAADFVAIATGAAAADWPRASGITVDARGFVRVDDHLQSVDAPGLFAAGDIASMDARAVPKSGVYAVRQGPVLAANLRASLTGAPLAAYRPQPSALALISTGGRHAIASRGPLAIAGDWVWRWKDHIDRKFMRKYSTLAASGSFGSS